MNPALARSCAVLGDEAVERLSSAHVAVFGVGGVGSWCAEALVRSGLGEITLVDFDSVAPSNINRQLMASAATLGELKVAALARRLAEIRPECRVHPVAERYESATAAKFHLSSFDCVIDAIDQVPSKALLIREALSVPSLAFFSSMGAALRRDPLRVKAGKFSRVTGDGLAKALRSRFKRPGEALRRDFTCVWSEEPQLKTAPGAPKGSLVTVTAAFGLALASLAINALGEPKKTPNKKTKFFLSEPQSPNP